MKAINRFDARARRLFTGILASLVGRSAAVIAPLIATPAMLVYLGDGDFGLWMTSISIIGMAVAADLGIGNGLLTRVSASHGKSDHAAIRQYLTSAYAALAAIAVACSGLVLLAVCFVPGYTILFATLLAFFFGLPATVFHQFLYGTQRVFVSHMVLVIGACGSVAACLAAIHLQAPHWAVVAAYGLPVPLASYFGAYLFFRRHADVRPRRNAIHADAIRDLLRLGAGFVVLSILIAIGLNMDNVIVSAIAGLDAVASYSIPMRLGSVLGLVILALYMPLWGANGEALAKGEFQWVRRSALRMSLFGSLFVLTSGTVLVLISEPLIQLWVGRSFEDQQHVLLSVVITSAIIAVTAPYNMILNAMGRVREQVMPWLVFVLISIGLKVTVLHAGHVWPIAAVTGIVYACTVMPSMIYTACRLLRRAEVEAAAQT